MGMILDACEQLVGKFIFWRRRVSQDKPGPPSTRGATAIGRAGKRSEISATRMRWDMSTRRGVSSYVDV